MNINTELLSTPLLSFADMVFTSADILIVMIAIFFLLLFFVLSRLIKSRMLAKAQTDDGLVNTRSQLNELLKIQAEMQGRMSTMAELFGSRQSEFNQDINQRLDGMSQKMNHSLTEQTRATQENLSRLQERLSIIDTAQNNIQSLAQNVVGLQAILSDKQTRGAFGQSRMETIIKDGLPMGAFKFQPTLSNGKRPDCTISMPNDSPDLVIDAKFPLEAWNAIKKADNEQMSVQANRQFRTDMEKHIKDIAEKYLIIGETQDTAFMFVPSESIFADIHENFEGVIQNAHRARIVIVSPSLLMLSIQVIQAILKDAGMREQANLIQSEVIRLMDDITRLDQRIHNLKNHFGQSQKDIDQILISTDKITKRSAKIEDMDFQDVPIKADTEDTANKAEPLSATRTIETKKSD